METTGNRERLAALDGMRGIAVLLVVAYHFFGRWTVAEGAPLYPYGDQFSRWPLAMDGQVGVDLFFMISGFVIFESLRRSANPLAFAAKRADRLVLPMVGLSVLSFVVLTVLPTPYFPVRLSYFLPSWTFTTPGFWQWLDPEVSFVDPVYWTLFIEVRFYILMALLWFGLGRSESRAVGALSVLAIGAVVAEGMLKSQGQDGALAVLDLALLPAHICLFASGVIYAQMYRSAATPVQKAALAILALVGTARVIGAPDDPALFINIIICLALFHCAFILLVRRSPLIGWLGARPLVFVGLISYSLYLVHQSVGLALISRLPADWPLALQLAGVAVVTAVLIAISYGSWRLLERQKPFSAMLALRRPASAL